MKFISCLLVIFLFVFSPSLEAQTTSNRVVVEGFIDNFHNQMQVEDMSEMQELNLPSLERTFIPDDRGAFSISFNLQQPNYFRIGRNILYLSPGDSLHVQLDFKAPTKAIFTGNNRACIEANQYLKLTPFPKEGSYLKAGENIKSTIQSSIDTILLMGLRRRQELASLKMVSKEFRRLESVRIKADMANSLLNIKTYYVWKFRVPKDSLKSFLANADKVLHPYVFGLLKDQADPSFLKLTVFRDMAYFIKDSLPNNINGKTIQDYLKALDLILKARRLDGKSKISELSPEIEQIQTPAYKSSVSKTFYRLLALNNGDPAIDFLIKNQNGKEVKLKDFAGKIIYIDIWATWCAPCLEELPFLDSLKQKFTGNKNIEFISLSIDDDNAKWKKHLEKNKLTSTQWIIDRKNLKDYNVITIPRTIIINRDFTIAAMNGGLPSSIRTFQFLNNLLSESIQ